MADYLSKHTGIEIDNSVDKSAELETRVTELEQKEVTANNGETTTDTLSTLKVGNTNYAVPSGGGSAKPEYEYIFRLRANGQDNSTQLDIYFTLRTTKLLDGYILPITSQQIDITLQVFIDLIKATYEVTSGYFTITNISGGFTTAGFPNVGGKDINLIYNANLTIGLIDNSFYLNLFNFGYNISVSDNTITTTQESGANQTQLDLSQSSIEIIQVLKLK